VLNLGRPRHALSRVCFIGPRSPLTPLPPPCVGACLTRPWFRRARRSGRCPSSSTVGFCDDCAPAQADHRRLGVRLGRRHVRPVQITRSSVCAHRASPLSVLSHRPCSAGCGTYTCSCSGLTACLGPSLWEIYPVLSIHLFLLTLSSNSV
jgi:hypothetical protein